MSEKNVYYDPEKCGLSILYTLNQSEIYEYNTFLVVQDNTTKRIFFVQDSGCSCPIPFESYHFNSVDDTNLNEVTLHNFSNFESRVEQFPVEMSGRQDCLIAVKSALKENIK